MELDLAGKHVLITGGCGEIGRALAEGFLNEGSCVVLLDTAAAAAAHGAELAGLKELGPLETLCCDLTDIPAIEGLTAVLQERFGHLDVLINNAGINRLCAAQDVTEALWDEVADVNVKGAFFLSKATLPLFIERGGSILNISSQHGLTGNLDRAPYCASKGGLVNLTRALCLEWARYNIRVNCLCPTYVLHGRSKEHLLQPGFSRSCLREIPLRRYCTPQDITAAALFLSSGRAGMITGVSLPIDGGYLAH